MSKKSDWNNEDVKFCKKNKLFYVMLCEQAKPKPKCVYMPNPNQTCCDEHKRKPNQTKLNLMWKSENQINMMWYERVKTKPKEKKSKSNWKWWARAGVKKPKNGNGERAGGRGWNTGGNFLMSGNIFEIFSKFWHCYIVMIMKYYNHRLLIFW